jgi:enoyl-CoA hydratase/carnithine racemase
MEIGAEALHKAGGALRATKRLLKQAFDRPGQSAVKVESREFSERLRSAEAIEAFTAFREKRPPNFSNLAKPVAAE